MPGAESYRRYDRYTLHDVRAGRSGLAVLWVNCRWSTKPEPMVYVSEGTRFGKHRCFLTPPCEAKPVVMTGFAFIFALVLDGETLSLAGACALVLKNRSLALRVGIE